MWLGVLLVSVALGAGALGSFLAPPKEARGLPLSDGPGVVGVSGGTPTWMYIRASTEARSLALVRKTDGPQLLVYPQCGRWPALNVPEGWSISWVTDTGEVLQVEVSKGQPIVPVVDAWGIFTAPGKGLKVGDRLILGGRTG